MTRILLAHANPSATRHLADFLSTQQCHAVQAADTSAARRELCAADFALALFHAELPGGAWEFCQKLRRHPELRKVPVAALTDTLNAPGVLQVVEHNLAGFVSLDMQPATAYSHIRKIVDRSQQSQPADTGGPVEVDFHGETVAATGDRRQLTNTLLDLLDAVAGIASQAGQEQQQRRETQRELVESEARKTAIFEAALDCIIVIDEQGVIQDFNAAAETRFGCPRRKAIGVELVELFIPPASQTRYRDNLRRYVHAGEMGSMLGRRLELQMKRLDGTRFVAEIAMQPFPMQGEAAFAIFLHDVSARREAEQQREVYAAELKRSNRDLADFAHAVSHDLQEPLRSMTSYCQLVQRLAGASLDEEQKEYLGSAIEAGGRMKRLLQDLLAYSRVSTRGREFQAVDLNQVAADAAANLEIAIEESGATVEFNNLPAVKGEKTQLMQLLQNLTGNAIKFRGERAPVVTISSQPAGAMCRIAVSDNGIGIPPQHVERVFTIFQRLHTSEEYEGTGIGLSLCKRIVERHGGEISVTSTPGEGSTFTFTLQASERPPGA